MGFIVYNQAMQLTDFIWFKMPRPVAFAFKSDVSSMMTLIALAMFSNWASTAETASDRQKDISVKS